MGYYFFGGIYYVAAMLVPLFSPVLALFSKKWRLRHRGIMSQREGLHAGSSKRRLWVHAASMGEFEQLKPIIETMRKEYGDDIAIIGTFFSPSGYEHQKKYPFLDGVFYLPHDTPWGGKIFVEALKPDAAVFARYDLWKYHLQALKEAQVPAILVSATLSPTSMYVKYGAGRRFAASMYDCFSLIYAAGEDDARRIEQTGTKTSVIRSGDTRFDRILERVQFARQQATKTLTFSPSTECIVVVGSSWTADELMIAAAYNSLEAAHRDKISFIIAPHEPTVENVGRLLQLFPDSKTVSQGELGETARHYIADSMGKLLSLYDYGTAAYIGGGFGAGVHSVTEPAGYGLPLACAPAIERARDAQILHATGALRVIASAGEVSAWLQWLIDCPEQSRKAGSIAEQYLLSNAGHTQTIVTSLNDMLSRKAKL